MFKYFNFHSEISIKKILQRLENIKEEIINFAVKILKNFMLVH